MATRRSDCTAPALSMSGSETRRLNMQRAVAEAFKRGAGRGRAQHVGMVLRALRQDGDHLFGIGIVADADLHVDGAQRVAMRPVQHAAGDQLGVGNDQAGAVEGFDLGGAHADAAHEALLVADDDAVADLDRPLDQQDQARHEIVDDRLQAKADADRQGAGDDGEVGDVEAGIGHRRAARRAQCRRSPPPCRRNWRCPGPGGIWSGTLPQPALEQRGWRTGER